MTTDMFLPIAQSALDLTIKGSVGEFGVATIQKSLGSVRVMYIESHLGLATHGDHEEKLLSRLAPVREVFAIQDLDFDQIMQRDIDDDRVSTDLIPYLLDLKGSRGVVKFFPPIIVAVLATDAKGNPASLYPEVVEQETSAGREGMSWHSLRSGSVGKEAFEFRQLKTAEGLLPHDYAELRLNTQKCKLAIIDGQHRAMALIALYRNLKGWPESTNKFRDYYRRWSPSVISQYDFSHVRLPIVFCVFPSLYEGATNPVVSVPEGCRAIFLALNKNAMKVTDSRNHLLNDKDLIASFLRSVLGDIKSVDLNSSRSLRLWNVELDSEHDRVPISNPVALTGAMHLYAMIEIMMLHDLVTGLSGRRSNLWKITKLHDCWRRLGVADLLSDDIRDASRRNNMSREVESLVVGKFAERHGAAIVRILDEFFPYQAHNLACIARETRLRNSAEQATFHSVLFEGQSQARVFKSYVEHIKQEIKDYETEQRIAVPPELRELSKDFLEKSRALDDEIAKLHEERGNQFLNEVPAWLRGQATVRHHVNRVLYANNFTTAAFQIGLVMTFFSVYETITSRQDDEALPHDDFEAMLTDFLRAMNAFFRPKEERGLKRIIRALSGEPSFSKEGESSIAPAVTLRSMLVPSGLDPKEWPRFRYIFLELWNSELPQVRAIVASEVLKCRRGAFDSFVKAALADHAREVGTLPKKLSSTKIEQLEQQCVKDFKAALKNLGKTDLDEAALLAPRAEATVEEEDDDETE